MANRLTPTTDIQRTPASSAPLPRTAGPSRRCGCRSGLLSNDLGMATIQVRANVILVYRYELLQLLDDLLCFANTNVDF
jgi:hypothetical protein